MFSCLLVVAALAGPGDVSVNDFRHVYRMAMRATAAPGMPSQIVVPRLIVVHGCLDEITGLSTTERQRMRRAIEHRLGRHLERLVRVQRRRDSPSLTQGGGASIAAAPLIELIVTTIAPESWRANGGPGTITYYPYNPALVIRQTSEVHEEVRALLRALAQ